MASIDKPLGRLSAWLSALGFAGLVALAFLPARTSGPAPPKTAVASPPAAASPKVATPQVQAPQAPSSSPVPPGAPAPATPGAPAAAPAAPPPDVWTPDELAAGLRQCLRLLAPVSADIELQDPMKHGQCGTPAPLLLHSVGAVDKIEFAPAPMLNCRLAASLSEWVEKVLQPVAQEMLGARIKRIVGASSYSCRNIYNNPKLSLSEHATGNAVDIAGFVTADGRTILVAKGWGPTERDIVAAKKKIADAKEAAAKKKGAKTADSGPTPSIEEAGKKSDANQKGRLHKTEFKHDADKPAELRTTAEVAPATSKEAIFLKRLHGGSCRVFATVLGPEANEAHRDHFHLDMKVRSSHAVCH